VHERPLTWRADPGWSVAGTRPLDASKVQAPGIARLPDGRWRLFSTGVGPGRPFPRCQGYVLSAVSDDGLRFTVEAGIRLAPDPDVPWMSRRVLAPTIAPLPDGRWRMYFEARGTADRPTVIASAVSDDLLVWRVEGVRLAQEGGDVGGPRYVALPDGRGRIYCFSRSDHSVVSATTRDGLAFEWDRGTRIQADGSEFETSGITAADVLPPAVPGRPWLMLYSAWQDVPPGTVVPPHPSSDPALADREDIDFATASIAADMAGYRSRIFAATSADGLAWQRTGVALAGDGYRGRDVGAVHAEDMAVVRLDDGRLRMYYAACDAHGVWRVASATTEEAE
jgi:hypothetical protein